MTAVSRPWPQTVRRAADAASLVYAAVDLLERPDAAGDALRLVYGPVVDLPIGQDLVDAVSTLALVLAWVGQERQKSMTQVVEELVAFAMPSGRGDLP